MSGSDHVSYELIDTKLAFTATLDNKFDSRVRVLNLGRTISAVLHLFLQRTIDPILTARTIIPPPRLLPEYLLQTVLVVLVTTSLQFTHRRNIVHLHTNDTLCVVC